jgi:Cu2+-exporting ATPase
MNDVKHYNECEANFVDVNNHMKIEQPIYIPLIGLESEHCAAIVDNALKEVPEIEAHKVELNNNRAVIKAIGQPEEAIQATVKRVRSLGYDVLSTTQTFPVLNLSCASCAANTEAILTHQTGVIKAEVNYANTSAKVEYIPSLVSPEALRQAVQASGYDLLINDQAASTVEEIKDKQYKALRKSTIGALLLALPLFIIGMFFMELPNANYIMWALATPLVFIYGKRFFIGAWKQAKHGLANMDTLVALSTGVAYIYSVFITFLPQLMQQLGIHSHVYFEAAGVVIAFILLGKLLEEKAKGSTSSAIKKLIGLQPKQVTVIHSDGYQLLVPAKDIKPGDTILVKPGEKIAVDGTVIAGDSYVDESMISGEPIPVIKHEGSTVLAGTINQKGSFQFNAEKVGSETMLAQIIKMVEDAQGSKAPVQQLVDKIAGVFVPIVMAIATLSLLIWAIFGGDDGFSRGIIAFVTVLVVACPCALGLATPTAIMVGVGKGAENGILIKDAESLELAKKINAVILDKTGTITEGKPKVKKIEWFVAPSQRLMNILYSIEKSSEHPLADAIANFLVPHAEFLAGIAIENISGQGIKGTLGKESFIIGNELLLKENLINLNETAKIWINGQLEAAQTVVLFCNSTSLLAAIAIADQIKLSAQKAIHELQQSHIDIYMLTGDNEQTAELVAKEIGINHYNANVLPGDKADAVKKLQQEGKIVAMVGDGINDSAALAQADVSIAMGKGSDIAIDVAKMTIISSDLLKIPEAIKLSKRTVQTIKQNLFWAFVYNVVCIPIAAGLLFPINGFLLDPMWAGAAMALSSVSVVSNSLRLKYRA